MPGEGIVPPQGFGGSGEKVKYFYGLPMSMQAGGGGTKVIAVVKMPPKMQNSGAVSARITAGDTIPYTYPAPDSNAAFNKKNGSAMRITIQNIPAVTTGQACIGGTRAFIVSQPVIVVQSGGGTTGINQGL